jgi:hypothetical protein
MPLVPKGFELTDQARTAILFLGEQGKAADVAAAELGSAMLTDLVNAGLIEAIRIPLLETTDSPRTSGQGVVTYYQPTRAGAEAVELGPDKIGQA